MGRGSLTAGSRWVTAGRAAVAACADLLLPPACASCGGPVRGAEGGLACGVCWSRLAPLAHPQCARCGHPTRGRPCRWCDVLPPFVRAVRSVCWVHAGTGGAFVHALKYDGWTGLAPGMAERMARLGWPADVLAERAMIVPVPLAAARLRERGYNQSAELARALAARWRIPANLEVLGRTRATPSQTRLTPAQRLRNVAGAFRVRDDARPALRGAHVVLLDDVVTTAATLVACAAALHDGGARIVSCVTFGRAPGAGDR